MNKRILVTVLILFVLKLNILAQKEYLNKVNQLNNQGQKEGYWVEDQGFDTIELYYKKGKKSGVFKSYSKTGILSTFGEYKDNKEVGIWYYFGDKGHLLSIQKDFVLNTDTIVLDNKEKYLYPNKCYTISYYPNGIIKEEGFLLWDEDPELDNVREYGEWRYYDENGILINTKLFK